VITPDASSYGKPVGDVSIDVHPAEIALIASIVYDARVVYVGEGDVIAH